MSVLGNFLILVSGILWAIELIPQLIRTIRTKSVEDISIFFPTICLTAYILFLIGSFLNHYWVLIIAHLVPFVNVLTLVILLIMYRKHK